MKPKPKKGPPKKEGKNEDAPLPDNHHLRFDEDIKTYYEILEISEDSTPEQARSAFKKLALKWHPDKNVGNSEAAAEMMKQINKANKVLSDPATKERYDSWLRRNPENQAGQDQEDFDQADFVVDPKVIQRNWMLLGGAWLLVLFLDWLLGISLLWVAAFLGWMGAYYFVPIDNVLKTQVCLVKLAIDVVMCLVVPSRWLAYLSNMALFGVAIMVQNILSFSMQIDLSLAALTVMGLMEAYRDSPYSMAFLAASGITSSIGLVFLAFLFGFHHMPVAPSYTLNGILLILSKRGDSWAYVTLLVWIPFAFIKTFISSAKWEWFCCGFFIIVAYIEILLFHPIKDLLSIVIGWALPSVLLWMFLPQPYLAMTCVVTQYLVLFWLFRQNELYSANKADKTWKPTWKSFFLEGSPLAYLVLGSIYIFTDTYFWTAKVGRWASFVGAQITVFAIYYMLQAHFRVCRVMAMTRSVPGIGLWESISARLERFVEDKRPEQQFDTKFSRRHAKKAERKTNKK